MQPQSSDRPTHTQLGQDHLTPNGLYVHIPFCKSKCIYCDFYSIVALSMADEVIAGLKRELDVRRSEISWPPQTIYLGGGTPSALSLNNIRSLLEALPTDTASEVTFEANPDDINAEMVETLKACGVNRLSMGVQSLDDGLLRTLRRRHDSYTALRAIATAREGGITNISADLIYGLPGMTDSQWTDSVTRLIESGITHLSAYCLTYSEGTPLTRALESGEITEADDETLSRQYDSLCRIAGSHGFDHYEISNFALPGYRSQHNSAYWRPDSQWLGIGPGAHSFDGKSRRANPSDIKQWLALGGHSASPEEESALDLLNDKIVAALRTAEGIDIDNIPEHYRQQLLDSAAAHIRSGRMTHTHGRLAIKPEFWLISNIFMRDMLLS